MGSGSRRRSIIAPRPCSRRLDAHGAEPRASGGPTARGMAWVTSPHGVKPDEPARGHGVTVYGLPCACPCGAGTFPGSFPGLSVGRPCGSPCGVPWAVPAGAAACAVASRTYRGRKSREGNKNFTFFETFFTFQRTQKKRPRRKQGRRRLCVDFCEGGGGLFPGPLDPHLDGGDCGV